MRPGDLVKFKIDYYYKSYGIGIVLGSKVPASFTERPRLRVLFGDEQVVARFDELEIVSESR